MDPAISLGSIALIEKEVAQILASFGYGNDHVFNLGCDITQWTDPEHTGAMINSVKTLSPQYHKI